MAKIEPFLHMTSPLQIFSASVASGLQSQTHHEYHNDLGGTSTISLSIVQQYYPLLTPERLSQIPDSTLIFFWAETARLDIQHHDQHELTGCISGQKTEPFRPSILTPTGVRIGQLDRTRGQNSLPDGEYEFAVICRQEYEDEELRIFLGSKPQLQLLQIGEVNGKGLPEERLNSAWLDEDLWKQFSKERKRRLVVLQ
jgi:hypothetical protein